MGVLPDFIGNTSLSQWEKERFEKSASVEVQACLLALLVARSGRLLRNSPAVLLFTIRLSRPS